MTNRRKSTMKFFIASVIVSLVSVRQLRCSAMKLQAFYDDMDSETESSSIFVDYSGESGSGGEAVDGNWSSWDNWSSCTRTCNGGLKDRIRRCDNPAPANGGRYCSGLSYEQTACNTQRCGPKPSLPSFICGTRNSLGRIVGGHVAKVKDWPWQVGLKQAADDLIFCGGSLINREWVLTAGHCINRLNPSKKGCVAPNPPLRVILGEFDVNNVDGHEVEIGVAQICMHPEYKHRTLENDVALLRLIRPVYKFNQYIRPVCLPSSTYTLPVGTNCSVTGFGRTVEGGALSNKLRHATVPVLRLNYCKTQYPAHVVNDFMICAGYEGGQIDSCKGDSGGPFVCRDPNVNSRFILSGAVSWGVGCARQGQPGVYTKVKSFLPWINKIIKET